MPDDTVLSARVNDSDIKGDESLRLLLAPIERYLNQDHVTDIFVHKPYELILKNHKGRQKVSVPCLLYTSRCV